MPALDGRDIIARAKTGTGKTLAFGIPIIKRLTTDDESRVASMCFSNSLLSSYLSLHAFSCNSLILRLTTLCKEVEPSSPRSGSSSNP